MNGQLEWKAQNGQWEPAIYHNAIRRQLLNRASENGRKVYAHPRARGNDPDDETAYHEDQKDWDPVRARWDTIEGDILHEINPRTSGRYDQILVNREPWMWGRQVVIDKDNKPLRAMPGLPDTISSRMEPYLFEAWCRIDSSKFMFASASFSCSNII